MDHPRLRSFNTPNPLSPIPPMKRSEFDFSAEAITFSLSSKASVPFTSTPDILDIPISPIKHEPLTDEELSSSSDDVYDVESLNSRLESLCYSDVAAVKDEDVFNTTNINNRQLNVSTLLADLGLKQYEPLMKEMDLISFLTLTDKDFLLMGVTDSHHRELFGNAIKMFCEI